MSKEPTKVAAEVIGVYPNKIRIAVDSITDFRVAEQELKVGSYLKVFDNDNSILISIIESFSIESDENGERKYIIDSFPLGIIIDDEFNRGSDSIAIPPKEVKPAVKEDIMKIFSTSIKEEKKFTFSKLSSNHDVIIPVDGDKFFNKHIAIIGSTGSGKSHTVAKIIQEAIMGKSSTYTGLNNSHIVVFDIHSEYKKAFPTSNLINIDNLTLPYWLLNGEELDTLFLESGDFNNYNQASLLRKLITANKKKYNPGIKKIFFDSPLKFDIEDILRALKNLRNETLNSKASSQIMIDDGTYTILTDGKTDSSHGILLTEEEKIEKYFESEFSFFPTKAQSITKGSYGDGSIDKFISRIETKIRQDRLDFLFGENSKEIEFEKAVMQFIGYDQKNNNVTVIDLSGVPFEVLSITVSLISRILFEFGYYYKRLKEKEGKKDEINNDVPLLIVFEEAHKYAPKSDLAKFKSSLAAIERIAKEGRKYGITLMLASQRPSEISETIFSQCNNFIAMRLTNPTDQNYVKRLLPDTLGNLTESLPSLKAGEAILIGDSIVMPSIIQIDKTDSPPSSSDIPYWELWKEEWKDIDMEEINKEWTK